jgi:hypothetical protein
VIHDAGAQGECASDARIRQVDPPATDQILQYRRVATIKSRLIPGTVVPAETHSAQFDRREELEHRLRVDQFCQQLRRGEILLDRLPELAEAVVAQ